MMMPSIFGENLFDDFMDFPFSKEFEKNFFGNKNPLYGKHAKNMMKTDVRETENGYEVDIDLPGFKKEEITAKLDNGYLTISASKGLDKEKQDKDGHYIRRERYAGSMSRSFYIGEGITENDVKAKYEDGILRLSIPKKEPKKVEDKKYISIEG
ncbi:MAG: Hsp20/alpha crystallin family protein [Clostridiales bacterium]|nr:Hsp20/alpha crystallin family protein [Clostridiales bacterium]